MSLFVEILREAFRTLAKGRRRMKKKRVYVSGPLTNGNTATYAEMKSNAIIACKAADRIMAAGYTPFVPHLTIFWTSEVTPEKTYDEWMDWAMTWLESCDFLVQCQKTQENGTGREWNKAIMGMGIPCYRSVDEFLFEEQLKEHNL